MQIIYEIKHHKDEGYDFENDPDKEFMTECAKVDNNPPETWKKYSNMTDILQMEVGEFIKTKSKKELYHIATVCLKMWRTMK